MTEPATPKTLTSALQAGQMIGSWCGFASFTSVEAMTLAGFDFLVLDMQHCEITQAHVPALLGAFHGEKPWPVVRVGKNDYHQINWLFDNGAGGVMVPMVNSVEEARRAVQASKFPPVGRRSFGPFRAARYGYELERYMSHADELSTLIVQIEDAAAARGIDEILAVPGVDAVFMGPNDLAYSMLKPNERLQGNFAQWSAIARTPQVMDLCAHVLERCQAVGKPFGITTVSMEDAQQWLQRGANFVTMGSDWAFLRSGVQSWRGAAATAK